MHPIKVCTEHNDERLIFRTVKIGYSAVILFTSFFHSDINIRGQFPPVFLIRQLGNTVSISKYKQV